MGEHPARARPSAATTRGLFTARASAKSETQSQYHVSRSAYFDSVSVEFFPFLAIAALLIVMPGPDTAMVTKNALVGGRRAGILAAVGVTIGLFIWTTAAALGIAAVLRASEVAFDALKFAGALYLAWIGIQMLRSRGVSARGPPGQSRERRTGAPAGAAVRPQQSEGRDLLHQPASAVRPRHRPRVRSAPPPRHRVRAAHSGLARCVRVRARARLGLPSPAVGAKWLDRATGVVLIGFSVRLALERR